MSQAKQVAKSVMASEKRKLQLMSKLKPVLNNNESAAKMSAGDDIDEVVTLPATNTEKTPTNDEQFRKTGALSPSKTIALPDVLYKQ